MAILALPLLFYVGRHYIDAEDGDYALYHTRGLMMAAPHYGLGKKEGLFIRPMSKSVRVNDDDDGKIDCFKVDTLRGCFYGLSRGGAQASWVLSPGCGAAECVAGVPPDGAGEGYHQKAYVAPVCRAAYLQGSMGGYNRG